MPKAPCVYRYRLTVPFFDVDSMAIVWHGHYVKYLEEARCAWLADLGYTYRSMHDDGYLWPIVQLQLKYVRPAVFDQRLSVDLYLEEYENSLKLAYEIREPESREIVCKATTRQMVVRGADRRSVFETPKKWQRLVHKYLEACGE